MPVTDIKSVQRGFVENLKQRLRLRRIDAGYTARVQAELDATVAQMKERVASGKSPWSSALRRDIAASASGYVSRLGDIEAEIAKVVPGIAYDGLDDLGGSFAAGKFRGAFRRPSEDLLAAALVSRPFEGRLLSQHAEKLGDELRAQVSARVAAGAISGQTSADIAKSLGQATGLSRAYAETWAITAVHHVHAVAREVSMRENADLIEGVMAVVTLDERTCPVCGPRDGLVWRLEHEGQAYVPDGHSVEYGGGPGRWHMRCRCTTIPVLDAEEAKAFLDLREGTRAARGAPTGVSADYEDWLRAEPIAVRRHVLGRMRSDWWDANPKVSLLDAWKSKFGNLPVEPEVIAPLPPRTPKIPTGFPAPDVPILSKDVHAAMAKDTAASGEAVLIQEKLTGHSSSQFDEWLDPVKRQSLKEASIESGENLYIATVGGPDQLTALVEAVNLTTPTDFVAYFGTDANLANVLLESGPGGAIRFRAARYLARTVDDAKQYAMVGSDAGAVVAVRVPKNSAVVATNTFYEADNLALLPGSRIVIESVEERLVDGKLVKYIVARVDDDGAALINQFVKEVAELDALVDEAVAIKKAAYLKELEAAKAAQIAEMEAAEALIGKKQLKKSKGKKQVGKELLIKSDHDKVVAEAILDDVVLPPKLASQAEVDAIGKVYASTSLADPNARFRLLADTMFRRGVKDGASLRHSAAVVFGGDVKIVGVGDFYSTKKFVPPGSLKHRAVFDALTARPLTNNYAVYYYSDELGAWSADFGTLVGYASDKRTVAQRLHDVLQHPDYAGLTVGEVRDQIEALLGVNGTGSWKLAGAAGDLGLDPIQSKLFADLNNLPSFNSLAGFDGVYNPATGLIENNLGSSAAEFVKKWADSMEATTNHILKFKSQSIKAYSYVVTDQTKHHAVDVQIASAIKAADDAAAAAAAAAEAAAIKAAQLDWAAQQAKVTAAAEQSAVKLGISAEKVEKVKAKIAELDAKIEAWKAAGKSLTGTKFQGQKKKLLAELEGAVVPHVKESIKAATASSPGYMAGAQAAVAKALERSAKALNFFTDSFAGTHKFRDWTMSTGWSAGMAQRIAQMPHTIKGAMRSYTGSAYVHWNSHLRNGGKVSALQSGPRSLAKALRESTITTEDMVVYRKVSKDDFMRHLRVGEEFRDAGFMSTSPPAAFAHGYQYGLEILIPKGSRGALYVEGSSAFTRERELLVAPGAMLRLLEIKYVMQGDVRVKMYVFEYLDRFDESVWS